MDKNSTFKEAVELTEGIIERFEKIEGRPWKAEGAFIELTKQVGELGRLLMVSEQYYFPDRDQLDHQYESTKEKIGDELADIFYAIIRIARHYDIDLLEAHVNARRIEDEFLKSKGV